MRLKYLGRLRTNQETVVVVRVSQTPIEHPLCHTTRYQAKTNSNFNIEAHFMMAEDNVEISNQPTRSLKTIVGIYERNS